MTSGLHRKLRRKTYEFCDSLQLSEISLKRDNEKFAPFMYKPGACAMNFQGGVPVYENGKWGRTDNIDMYFDEAGVEQFKSRPCLSSAQTTNTSQYVSFSAANNLNHFNR
jgi:hypothetical protein